MLNDTNDIEQASDSQNLTAIDLANDVYYSATWDELHCCQEVAIGDCPYQQDLDCVFDVQDSISKMRCLFDEADPQHSEIALFVKEATENGNMDNISVSEQTDAKLKGICDLAQSICKKANALHEAGASSAQWLDVCHKPLMCEGADALLISDEWCMSNVQRSYPRLDAEHHWTRDVMQVETTLPTAALAVHISEKVKEEVDEMIRERSLSGIPLELSPRTDCTTVELFSTVFMSLPSEISLETVYPAYRYSRFATNTLVRQLDVVGISAPVFGVCLTEWHAFIHVDWASRTDDVTQVNTVLILEDEIEYETKRWDLREPKDVLELCIILDNLRRYTADRFSGLVEKELFSLRKRLEEGEMKSWKWDGRVEIEDESGEDTSVSSEEEGSELFEECNENGWDKKEMELWLVRNQDLPSPPCSP